MGMVRDREVRWSCQDVGMLPAIDAWRFLHSNGVVQLLSAGLHTYPWASGFLAYYSSRKFPVWLGQSLGIAGA